MKIIGIGDLVLDCYIRDSKVIGYNGGKTFANIIVNLTKYNYDLEVMGAVGNDKEGLLCIKSLRDLNIITKKIDIVNSETRCFFVNEKISTRMSPFLNRKIGYSGSKIIQKNIISNIKENDILVFDVINQKTLDIVDQCKNNIKMLDIGYFNNFINKDINDIKKTISNKFSIINMNERVFKIFKNKFKLSEVELYKFLNVKLLIITKGKIGASFIYNNKCQNKNLEIVSEDIDPSGAGDSFFAEIINIFIINNYKVNDEIIEEMFIKGSTVSRNTVLKIGARSNLQKLYKKI